MSTSDYSSNNSISSFSTTAKRTSGDSNQTRRLSPTSDISDTEPMDQLGAPATHKLKMADFGWESDEGGSPQDACESDAWNEAADAHFLAGIVERSKGVLISQGPVKLLIPQHNKLSIPKTQFKISVIEDPLLKPRTSLRTHHISKVVSVSPQVSCFSLQHPAYIIIPVEVEPENPAWISCLYSNTSTSEHVDWQPLPKCSYRFHDGHVMLKTCSLALFTIIYKEPLPETSKRIRRRIGGSLRLPNLPGLKITFPRGSCDVDIDASIKVLYDYEPPDPDKLNDPEVMEGTLACPIIMVGPPGYQFNMNRKPVEIELPVPHYREIVSRWPSAILSIWQSSTRENEVLNWQQVEVDRLSVHQYRCGLVSISFPTFHFTFFKVVWDILTNKLNEAKMGVSYFYPWISFPMKCQAYMEENPDNKAFGLEVICFNAEANQTQIQTSNYRYCVGSSLKPKLVRPGRILVKLRSQKFSADVSAGEEDQMEKEEPDFRGRDFEKQFACIFREDIKVDRGTFGKVIVDRLGIDRQKQENLFEFNIQKSGVETELAPTDTSDRWSVVAVKELAGHLALMEESNWKHFANYIGFTRQEIKSKLQHSPDPFLTMMNLYQNRGGTPEEFVQALYSVSRDMNMGSSSASNKSGTPGSTSSGISGSGSQRSQRSQDSAQQITKRFSFFGLTPWRNDEDSDSGTADMNAVDTSPADSKDSRKRTREKVLEDLEESQSKKRRTADGPPSVHHSHDRHSWKRGGEKEKHKVGGDKLRSGGDSYSSSDESGNDDNNQGARRVKSVSTEHYKRNPYKLSDQDLWQISAHMNAINWRALGRTLGLEESILLNLEHAHKGSGMRECAYQTLLNWKTRPKNCTFGGLYTALCEEKMNSVAKHMSNLLSQGSIKC